MDDLIFLKRVLNVIPGHIYWKDVKGRYLGCNKQQALSLGMTADEMIGKTDFELPWKSRAQELSDVDQRVMRENRKIEVEETVQLPNNDYLSTFLTQKTPLLNDNGDIVGIIGVSQDITEKKRLKDRQEEILAKYQEFVSNQEHDIRTPISCVVGLSESLIDLLSEPEHIELAKHINESAKAQQAYQNSLIDGIYLFEEQTESFSRRFNLKTTIEEVKSIYACAFKANQLSVEMLYDESLPRYLWGDWFRLQKILVCLLSNSVKFTESGGKVWIRCNGISKSEQEIVLSIEVEDTGVGIAEDKLATIFEPFSRLTLSNLGRYPGRGLGLTLAKKMVRELNGEIDVTSVIGKGSVFHLLVPFQQSLSSKNTPLPKGKN